MSDTGQQPPAAPAEAGDGFSRYLALVRDRLAKAGFEVSAGDGEGALVGHRRQAKLSRFGLVDTTVTIARGGPEASAADLTAVEAQAFDNAMRRKSSIPRGFGSSVVSYPVLVVDRATPELRTFAEQYVPKHWSVMDFPVVIELSTGPAISVTKTPAWGAAYYKKTRQEATDLLTPA